MSISWHPASVLTPEELSVKRLEQKGKEAANILKGVYQRLGKNTVCKIRRESNQKPPWAPMAADQRAWVACSRLDAEQMRGVT